MRTWRQRRRLSQLELAIEADVSPRHVSFIETGRSTPSRAMVLRLAAVLDVPLRDQNQLLLAAGLAPAYGERSLDDPEMAAVRAGVERVLLAYNPFPCVVVDRSWQIVHANDGAALLLDGVAPHLLEQPNALRIALHPEGLAPRIRNFGQWRDHLVERLRREVAVGGDAELSALLTEMESHTGGLTDPPDSRDLGGVAVPLELYTPDGRLLTFLSTVTTFGTARDLTAAELSIEAFLPADESTAAALH
ncbi:helix-turn-helix transcriptional regulator [Mycobacterium deserti]|uniref:Helix-turn-helix transcriptional regulator n=1 Tax=Mycobacterium deserti TaxID=2978347 RepID=A0ABT2MHW5_9MYCO|nr:helix-turn-helix transcriptional regulator [Mycobacterium deserti]MCT7661874.1 helix-turn-helix transcriptional regulator [Mycobacterium deserti]